MRPTGLVFGALLKAALPSLSVNMRLLTYNIRLKSDDLRNLEKPWDERAPLMMTQLHYETAGRPESLLCFQEAVSDQVDDLAKGLGNSWARIGQGRDGGGNGEFSPIFYQPSQWSLKRNATYWLSETPDKLGSRGWDAELPRIVTVAQFQHHGTGAPFVYMCTHFDHRGPEARQKSAELIAKIANEWAQDGTIPVFVAGDLNSTPEDGGYKTLSEFMKDVKDVVPEQRRFGFKSTFTSFDAREFGGREFDHIFVQDASLIDGWESFAVLDNKFDDAPRISDHRPVVVDFKVSVKNPTRIRG